MSELFPLPAVVNSDLVELLKKHETLRLLRRKAAVCALDALSNHLVPALSHRTGQSYKLRALMWSLYNGRPADLSDVLGLDYELCQALATLIVGFGYESADVKCFYDAMKDAILRHGGQSLWDWFSAAGEEDRS